MSRKYIFLLSGMLVILVAFLSLYISLRKDASVVAWSAVPENAVAVIECTQPLQSLTAWQQSSVYSSLRSLPYIQKVMERIAYIRNYPDIEAVLKQKQILASLHVTTHSDFDYLFFIPLTEEEEEKAWMVKDSLLQNKDFRVSQHTYSGQIITEITDRATLQTFSFLFYKHVLIGSYTSFLVEDAIRTLEQNSVFHKGQWYEWQKQAAGEQDIHMYMNLKALPQLSQVLTGKRVETGVVGQAGQFTALTVDLQADAVVCEGQTVLSAPDEASEYFHIFAGQSAHPLQCAAFVPARAGIVYHWSFSDARGFLQKKRAYDVAHGTREPDTPLPAWVGHEMALALIESLQEEPHRIGIVQASDVEQARQALKRAHATQSAAYQESYKGFSIQKIGVRHFPAVLFGQEMNGFEECFYTVLKKYVVFGNSLQAVRTAIDSYTTGQHWKAPASKPLTSFFVEVDVEHSWGIWQHEAAAHWKALLQQHSKELKNVEKLTLHISPPEGKILTTSLVLHCRPTTEEKPTQNRFFNSWSITADTLVSLAPTWVHNHVDQSREVLIQDAAHRLYLINSKGKQLWRSPVPQAAQTPVFQIDYLKNNKLQYLFATRSAIHLMDRNGHTVAPFPIPFQAATPLHTLTVVDYEHTHDYRFLAADMLGNLYMYDKTGNLLEGWQPLHTGYRLQCAPVHIRLQEKDYFAILQANGKLRLFNRKGQEYAGFPVDLNIRTESPFWIEEGQSPAGTTLVVVSENGEVIRVNLLGEITSRRQLARTAGDNIFYLCTEPQKRDWILYRTDSRVIGILDKNGTLLFEVPSHPTDKQYVQYYNFGSGLRVVAITYAATKQTFLYTLTGTLIGNEPFANQLPIALIYSDVYDKLLIHSVIGRKIEARTLKMR